MTMPRQTPNFEDLFNSLDEAVILADAGMNILAMNRAAEETLAARAPDRSGYRLTDCLPWLKEYEGALAGCRDEGRTYIVSVRPGGAEPLRVSLSPYRSVTSSTARAEGVVVAFHPAGIESRDRERLAFESMNQIVARIAHEIRTPLGGIRGAAQLLMGMLQNEGGEHAAVIVREVDRLQGILQDLLDMARPAPPVFVALNVHETVERALTVLAPVLDNHSIRIRRHFDPSLPEVSGDPSRLIQVFLNIIQNAAQAMPEGGILDVATRPSSEYLHTPDGATRRWVLVSFADTGPGIPPEELDRIFLPFYTRRQGGTGLGLAISKKIMLDHHGFLEAANRPRGGALFNVSVPFRDTVSATQS